MSEARDKVEQAIAKLSELPSGDELKPQELPDFADIAKKTGFAAKAMRIGAVVLGVLAAVLLVIAVALCVRAGVRMANATPEATASAALHAVVSHDRSAFAGCYAGNPDELDHDVDTALAGAIGLESSTTVPLELDASHQKAYDAFLARLVDFDYEVGQAQVDGDSATVQVTVKTRDLDAYFNDCMSDYLARTLADARYTGAVSNQNQARLFVDVADEHAQQLGGKDQSATVELRLVRAGGTWKLDTLDASELDALTGGFFGALEQVGNSYYHANAPS